MTQKKFDITQEGLEKLKVEYEQLISTRRKEVADKIKRAREMGGTENNAEYEDAKNEQAFIEGRIGSLENIILNARIIESPHLPGVVELGDNVLIQNQDGKIDRYTIVGTTEASPVDGKISCESPVGKALLGKKKGDKVEVRTPAGIIKLQIIEVS
ncbi:MAG: transcription elongation factor GreA [Dehalococcoidia bacterium]|nr:transcription elongation factor GreA [Dehalococcoidia bacterium]MDD5493770.1 transcription elongation factor GreA [Dehalococcoidia bacterium]